MKRKPPQKPATTAAASGVAVSCAATGSAAPDAGSGRYVAGSTACGRRGFSHSRRSWSPPGWWAEPRVVALGSDCATLRCAWPLLFAGESSEQPAVCAKGAARADGGAEDRACEDTPHSAEEMPCCFPPPPADARGRWRATPRGRRGRACQGTHHGARHVARGNRRLCTSRREGSSQRPSTACEARDAEPAAYQLPPCAPVKRVRGARARVRQRTSLNFPLACTGGAGWCPCHRGHRPRARAAAPPAGHHERPPPRPSTAGVAARSVGGCALLLGACTHTCRMLACAAWDLGAAVECCSRDACSACLCLCLSRSRRLTRATLAAGPPWPSPESARF